MLAAGEGTRLRPITAALPKPLCPVGNVPLLDRALDRLAAHGLHGPGDVAVNACYLAEQVATHLDGRARLSLEPGPPALGTSGALAHLRDWIAGRSVLAVNADAFLLPAHRFARPDLLPAHRFARPDPSLAPGRDLAPLLDGWDGHSVRILTVPAGDLPAEFTGRRRFAGVSLLPAELVSALVVGPSALVLSIWRPAERAGRLELVDYDGHYIDTGTPADYLAANLACLGGDGASLIAPTATVSGRTTSSVVGAGAVVAGDVTRCVVLPGATVAAGESLVDTIRLGTAVTVKVSV